MQGDPLYLSGETFGTKDTVTRLSFLVVRRPTPNLQMALSKKKRKEISVASRTCPKSRLKQSTPL